jgi:hypothetical protein
MCEYLLFAGPEPEVNRKKSMTDLSGTGKLLVTNGPAMLVGWVCLAFFSPLLEPPLHAWVNRCEKEAFTVILRTKTKKPAGSYL